MYQDKNDTSIEGMPTEEKTSVKSSLRIKPLLTGSSTIKNNKRVADVHITIAKTQESGIRFLNTLKQALTIEA
jgi:hypothetical protein